MSFAKIKGNSLAIKILKEEAKKRIFPRVYLFVGPAGIGKKTAAFTFSQLINCPRPTADFEPCGECMSCKKIDKKEYPDLHIIETQEDVDLEGDSLVSSEQKVSNIKIEKILEIQRELSLLTYESEYKMLIVDNAENLTEEAANAFLKTLEEPPANAVIILISARAEALLKTVVSRCKLIRFYPLSKEKLKEILSEEYGITSTEAHFLAYFSEGRLGYALKIRDHPIIKERYKIIQSFLSRDKALVSEGLEDRNNLKLALLLLIFWFRDLYLIKLEPETDDLIFLEHKKELLKLRHYFLLLNIENIIKQLNLGISYLKKNINPKLLLANIKPWIWQDLYF